MPTSLIRCLTGALRRKHQTHCPTRQYLDCLRIHQVTKSRLETDIALRYPKICYDNHLSKKRYVDRKSSSVMKTDFGGDSSAELGQGRRGVSLN